MRYGSNWIAASIFFLAGCMTSLVPAVVRGQFYAARMSTGSWSYPDELIERMVPEYKGIASLAFVLSVVALVFPAIAKAITTKSRTPTN